MQARNLNPDPTRDSATPEYDGLVERALSGDESAFAEVFTRDRERLLRMVELRLDLRLARRVEAADVLQEAYLELSRQLPSFAEKRNLPFFLWTRLVTSQCLAKLHRKHLDTKKRDVRLEVSLHSGRLPQATSVALASQLLGRFTSPSQRAIRAESLGQLQLALEDMEPMDREVLALRHLEDLTNNEVALELGLQKSAATKRYMRALKRLREAMDRIPGAIESEG